MVQIPVKDRRILAALAENPKQSYSRMGRKAGVSPAAARYKVNQFLKRKMVLGFMPAIDYSKLGYLTYDVFFSIGANEKEMEGLKKAIQSHPSIIWAALLFGKRDLYAQFIARDAEEFYEALKKFCEEFSFIEDYEVKILIRRLKIEHFIPELKGLVGKKPVKEAKGHAEIDSTDFKVLSAVSKNALAQYHEIAEKAGLSMETARNRMLALSKKGVIQGIFPLFDYSSFGYSQFFVFFDVKNSTAREERLVKILAGHDNVKLLFRTIENQLFSFCIFRTVDDFEKLWRRLKNEFGDILQGMEYYAMSEEIKLDMWPFREETRSSRPRLK